MFDFANCIPIHLVKLVMGRVGKSRVQASPSLLKSRARSSPSHDSSSKIEYELAKKCRVRVESMPSLDSDPLLVVMCQVRARPSLKKSSLIESES